MAASSVPRLALIPFDSENASRNFMLSKKILLSSSGKSSGTIAATATAMLRIAAVPQPAYSRPRLSPMSRLEQSSRTVIRACCPAWVRTLRKRKGRVVARLTTATPAGLAQPRSRQLLAQPLQVMLPHRCGWFEVSLQHWCVVWRYGHKRA